MHATFAGVQRKPMAVLTLAYRAKLIRLVVSLVELLVLVLFSSR